MFFRCVCSIPLLSPRWALHRTIAAEMLVPDSLSMLVWREMLTRSGEVSTPSTGLFELEQEL
jgi:hypothetical protein